METEEVKAPVREGKRKLTIDLEAMSVEELTALRDAAEARRQEKVGEVRDEIVREFEKNLAGIGLSPADVYPSFLPSGRKKRTDTAAKRKPVEVKYRGPNPEDTWTGRGMEPKWLKTLMAEGHKKEEYALSQ